MGNIHVLDFSVANLIAAGEVVDRPASVVKELLENAIDANASAITVEIKRGGVSFIRVTDNGIGMAREDVPVALKRHATSKISEAKDLDAITTLGFRGEALAAIASVSELRILTKRASDPMGTVLSSVGGKVESISEAPCQDGTTVIIENLFFNTPARLKFLKKEGIEAAGVASYVEKIALSHPEISVRFISDGQLKYATTGDGIRHSCIYAVLGREFAKKCMEIGGGLDGIVVSGYIGTPEMVRGNRNLQIFFLNNRFIRSKTVAAALEQAFSTYISGDKFPCAVLYLSVNPSLVDINVHPAKLEVKFANERTVFESVYYAVRGALENNLSRPELSILAKADRTQKAREQISGFAPIKEGRGGEQAPSAASLRRTLEEGIRTIEPQQKNGAGTETEKRPAKAKEQLLQGNRNETDAFAFDIPPLPNEAPPQTEPIASVFDKIAERYYPIGDTIPPQAAVSQHENNQTTMSEVGTAKELREDTPTKIHKDVSNVKQAEESAFSYMKLPPLPKKTTLERESVPKEKMQEKPEYRLIGEVFQCYVIAEMGNTMYIIDKHAAHERILFEQLKKNAAQGEHAMQMLLMPITVSLTAEEAESADTYQKELFDIGFAFSLEDGMASIDAIPAFLDTAAATDAFAEAVTRLSEHTGTADLSAKQRFEGALFSAACKAAIKAGRNYDTAHLRWICDRVLSDPEIRYCPHGRPVCFELTHSAIESHFGRT